jgi:hypothetical protein
MCLYKNLAKAVGIICMLSLFCITNVCAKDEVSAWVGISRIKSKDMNGMFSDRLNDINEHFEIGVGGEGLEYMHDIDNNFKIGARVGVTRKKVIFTPTPKGKLDLSIKDNNSYCKIMIMPMMFGGSYSRNIGRNFSLIGKSFLGYALVDFKSKNSFTLRDTSSEKIAKELNKTTGCFILDSSIGVEWLFTKRFGIGFDVGYRFTPEIEVSKAIKLNFSGVTVALNLSYKV